MTTIALRLQQVRDQIAHACAAHARPPGAVALLAVSKTQPAERVREAFAAGQTAFGENYVQEGVAKIQVLHDLPIEWHCIGPLQANKTRLVAEHFAWVHTVDRLKTAQRLSDQRPAHLPPLQVCLQLNVDGATTKAGVPVMPVDEMLALAFAVAKLPRLTLRGIMSLPDFTPDFMVQCRDHSGAAIAFRQIFDALALSPDAELRGSATHFDTLSMGMTADLEAAIAEGSTLVRVGSAIFGARH